MSLTKEILQTILESRNIDELNGEALVNSVTNQAGIGNYVPDGICQIDPRSGDRIVFNTARAKRPHDNRPPAGPIAAAGSSCVICQGKTTGAIDVRDLSQGFTFINKNLFPMVFPNQKSGATLTATPAPGALDAVTNAGSPSFGLHLLQWTSSVHDQDWHNMSSEDGAIVMGRLAALEKQLLHSGLLTAVDNRAWGDDPKRHGYVGIIKNCGRLVGGSLEHGHQQIAFTNACPRRLSDNLRFEQQQGECFTQYLLRSNPAELLVQDFGRCVLVVPYFMRRPFDLMLILKDTKRRYLHDLDAEEIAQVAQGWCMALRLLVDVMPRVGREIAYNVITHNGPGAGLYFEFLPYTQETGGYEQLGLYVCNGNPQGCAQSLRELR